jgi:hypothetical protein
MAVSLLTAMAHDGWLPNLQENSNGCIILQNDLKNI